MRTAILLVLSLFGAIATDEKLKWKDDDGLEIKITKVIKESKCKLKSKAGDVVLQYYKLSDENGKELGSNFGGKPYKFTLGANEVIAGMDRAMTGMCVGEKRKVVIPPKLGFSDKGRERDKISKEQALYYTVQLVDIMRPGKKWMTDEGLTIEVHQQYELRLEDGTWVDSSYSRKTPFKFTLHNNEVIYGMDIAMTEMCEGERRNVIIPPDYGYGKEGSPPEIPGGAYLHFDILLEKLIKKDEL